MRTNKFIPFLVALLLHALPLSYFLFTKKEIVTVSEGDSRGSRMMGIDLSHFSVARKSKVSSSEIKPVKSDNHQTKPSETVGLNPSSGAAQASGPSTSGVGNGPGNSSGPSNAIHFTQMHEPVYPPIARQKGLEGRVKIKAFYNADGNIIKADIVESSGVTMLDESAKKTVRDWKVTPGTAGEFEKTFEFKLKN